MSEERLNLTSNINTTIIEIGKDINEIKDILAEIYKAMLSLDESKWKSHEKDKIDEEFMPYLKKISEKYPLYLTKRLDFLKSSVERYQNLDKEISNLTANLEDII